MTKKLIELVKNDNTPLKKVALHDEFSVLAQSANADLLNYLFGKENDDVGKLSEILDLILTNNETREEGEKSIEGDEGTAFSDERKAAHNLCTLFTNKDAKLKKLGKLFESKSKNILINKLKRYVNENSDDSITASRFSQLIRNLISINNNLIPDNPWLLSPILAFPDRIGYSTLLFTILRVNPQFYKFATMRSSDFMRKADKDHKNFDKCSFVLLNIFSLLIKANELKFEHFNVETMKDILDVTLIGYDKYKLAFYEGIFITSSIINDKRVNPKSAIARYVKARGKAFYKKLGLDDMKISPDINLDEIKPELKDIIASFPAFYKSGFNQLYKLMFCPHNVVSSDFGRICLDYIVSMPEAKFNRFIDDNKIKKLIMDNMPKLPNDEELLDSEENIQYLNPHVILLAFYIIEGLPKVRGTDDNTIVPNPYSPDSTRDEKFLQFVVERVLPFRQLVLPDLTKYKHPEGAVVNGR